VSGSQNGAGAGTAILQRLGALEKKLDLLMVHFGLGANGKPSGGSRSTSGDIASVDDIRGQYGDVKVRMNPKRWTGEPMKGRTASQCPPDFLEIYAEQLDYFAGKQEDSKKASYDRRDAARCRRWAVEIREGRVKQAPAGAPADNGYPADWDDTPPARPTPRSAGNTPPADPWGGEGTSGWEDDGTF
jgi:hypothetical protein